MVRSLVSTLALGLLLGCGPLDSGPEMAEPVLGGDGLSAQREREFERRLPEMLVEAGAFTLAAGLIRSGELVWSGVYGEQAPGHAADSSTLFNTASVSKAVTAETVLRLVERGDLLLDEPLAGSWVDPDVAQDPRHELLTPRMVLTHRTGFPNWRYMAEDGRLAFEADPGSRFGYSGEGMQYLKRFVEEKLERPFEHWVRKLVFDPLEMNSSAVVRHFWMEGQMVIPRSADEGRPLEPNVNPPGSANAADDLFTTVEDYSKLLRTLMRDGGSRGELAEEKMTLHTDVSDHSNWSCTPASSLRCPSRYGFGLGWLVFEWEGQKLVWHGGNDATEHAIGYLNPATGDGAIVFVNGAVGLTLMIDVLDFIDEGNLLTDFYRLLLGASSS